MRRWARGVLSHSPPPHRGRGAGEGGGGESAGRLATSSPADRGPSARASSRARRWGSAIASNTSTRRRYAFAYITASKYLARSRGDVIGATSHASAPATTGSQLDRRRVARLEPALPVPR